MKVFSRAQTFFWLDTWLGETPLIQLLLSTLSLVGSFKLVRDYLCHAPIPGPTRMMDPNRVRGARLKTRTLYLIFFFLNRTDTCGYGPHLITESKELQPEWCPSNSIHIY